MTDMQHLTVAQCLVLTMKGRGKMSNHSIYQEMKKLFEERGRQLIPDWKAEVRQTLQAHCMSRPQWNGRDDLFDWHGRGYRSTKLLDVSRLITIILDDPSVELPEF